MKKIILGLSLMLGMLVTSAQAHEFKVGDITIEHPWARASATSVARAGGAFLTLHNMGDSDDVLIGATTPNAKKAEVHGHKMNDAGMMKMYPYGPLTIPAKGKVELKPGGLHVMLMKLKAPLIEGEMFPVTLTFEKAGDVTIEVIIDEVGAMGNTDSAMEGMDHSNMDMTN